MAEQRGQVLPLAALIIVLAGVACLGLARLGGQALARAEARTAADAAALAGAAAGREAAAEAALANNARLTAYDATGADVEVSVAGARATATARARREGVPAGHCPPSTPTASATTTSAPDPACQNQG